MPSGNWIWALKSHRVSSIPGLGRLPVFPKDMAIVNALDVLGLAAFCDLDCSITQYVVLQKGAASTGGSLYSLSHRSRQPSWFLLFFHQRASAQPSFPQSRLPVPGRCRYSSFHNRDNDHTCRRQICQNRNRRRCYRLCTLSHPESHPFPRHCQWDHCKPVLIVSVRLPCCLKLRCKAAFPDPFIEVAKGAGPKDLRCRVDAPGKFREVSFRNSPTLARLRGVQMGARFCDARTRISYKANSG
jgi:hypothetical protein